MVSTHLIRTGTAHISCGYSIFSIDPLTMPPEWYCDTPRVRLVCRCNGLYHLDPISVSSNSLYFRDLTLIVELSRALLSEWGSWDVATTILNMFVSGALWVIQRAVQSRSWGWCWAHHQQGIWSSCNGGSKPVASTLGLGLLESNRFIMNYSQHDHL